MHLDLAGNGQADRIDVKLGFTAVKSGSNELETPAGQRRRGGMRGGQGFPDACPDGLSVKGCHSRHLHFDGPLDHVNPRPEEVGLAGVQIPRHTLDPFTDCIRFYVTCVIPAVHLGGETFVGSRSADGRPTVHLLHPPVEGDLTRFGTDDHQGGLAARAIVGVTGLTTVGVGAGDQPVGGVIREEGFLVLGIGHLGQLLTVSTPHQPGPVAVGIHPRCGAVLRVERLECQVPRRVFRPGINAVIKMVRGDELVQRRIDHGLGRFVFSFRLKCKSRALRRVAALLDKLGDVNLPDVYVIDVEMSGTTVGDKLQPDTGGIPARCHHPV